MEALLARVDRRALLVTALGFVVWRLLGQISVVDLDGRFITTRLELYSQPGFFAAIGPNSIRFGSYSIGYLGIGPYVQVLVLASIVPVLLPRLRNLLATPGREIAFRRWTRAIAVLWSLGTAYGWTTLAWNAGALPFNIDWSTRLIICVQLAAGTAVMIMLADALDEFGLGFGYGAFIFYALGYVAGEVHRIGEYLAATPSVEALYRPLAIRAAITTGLTIAGVAALLAVRRIPSPFEEERKRGATVDIRLVTSGVLRPPAFAFAFMAFPGIVATFYTQTNPVVATWFAGNWGAYGDTAWLSAVYLVVEASLVALFATFITAFDHQMVPAPTPIYPHVARLAVLGGVFLALAAVAAPVANHFLTQAAGALIPVSGLDVLLVVAVVLVVVRAIEGHRTAAPLTATPLRIP